MRMNPFNVLFVKQTIRHGLSLLLCHHVQMWPRSAYVCGFMKCNVYYTEGPIFFSSPSKSWVKATVARTRADHVRSVHRHYRRY